MNQSSYYISDKTTLGGQVNWKITFHDEPTRDQVADIIEGEFPAAGYGVSYVSRPIILEGKWVVFVSSNASCD